MNFLSILLRKTRTLLFKRLLYPFLYRPVGLYANYQTFLERYPTAQYQEIYPAYFSDRSQSRSFYEDTQNTEDDIHNPVKIQIGAAFVLFIPNGRACTDLGANLAYFSPEKKLIPEVCFQYNERTGYISPNQNGFFRKKYFEKLEKKKGIVFSLVSAGGANTNYFHFLFDSLTRLHLLRKTGWFDRVDWFWIPNQAYKFQKEILEAAGVPPEKWLNSQEKQHIEADTMICTHLSRPRGHISKWMCEYVESLMISQKNDYSPYIFISRADAPTRRLTNETAWEKYLKPLGFKKYVLSTLSWQEQANLFAQASCVVAQHGAGLSNLVFSNAPCLVVELYHENYFNPDFFGISQQKGLNHVRFPCQHAQAHDLLLDWEKLLIELKKHL